MALSRPSDFHVLALAGRAAFVIQRIIGKVEEWLACIDNTQHLWAFLNRRQLLQWSSSDPLDETSTSYVAQFEETATPADERATNTGSSCTYWVDHAAGDVKIEVFASDGSTLLASATHNATTRAQDSNTISLSSASADDLVIRVSTKWDGVTGSNHTLYGVWVQETELLLSDMK